MKRSTLLIALALIAAACGRGQPDPEFGMKRFALDLAFSEEELAEPVEPERIIRIIPAPPEVQQPQDLEPFRRPAEPAEPTQPPPLVPVCPAAPSAAAPADVVTVAIDAPPEPGRYNRHNQGTINVTGGPFPITLPFPPLSVWDHPPIEQIEEPAPFGVGDPETYMEYEIHKVLTPTVQVIDRFRLTDSAVQLVQRTTVNEDVQTEFAPEPPIDFYVFGVEGDAWRSAGIDQESGTSMLFEGRIESREVVDVCGTVYDTYRVVATVTLVNLRTGEVTGTDDGEPNVYNVATHLGGLIVREEVHTTQNTRDPDSGSPLVIELDYVSTLASVEPEVIPR